MAHGEHPVIGKDIAAVWEKDRAPFGRSKATPAQIEAAIPRAREAALRSEATRELREDVAAMAREGRRGSAVPRVRG